MNPTNTLYLECYSGISGDMMVGALLDLGADPDVLRSGLDSLHVEGYTIQITRSQRSSIDACDFHVLLAHPEHDPYPKVSEQDHSHEHTHGEPHIIEPIHLGHHEHRNLSEIVAIIDGSSITDKAKTTAKRIFTIVAQAEAKAHGKPVDEVHFHEVGAVDSIVDIVATAICLDNLGIDAVIVSELYEGTGQVTCQHGVLPIPVPAVVNIAAAHHLPLHLTQVRGELVTPTGAAIAAAIRTEWELPKTFTIRKIGLGSGKRNYEVPSLLRAMLLDIGTEPTQTVIPHQSNTADTDSIWVLEANLDDCSGEALSLTMEILLEQGARDVYYSPIYMKKNRPAYLLGVLCQEEAISRLEEIIFTHTTTIGIRKRKEARVILPRQILTCDTPYGPAAIKCCSYKDQVFFYPEYESVRSICRDSGLDYGTVYHQLQEIARDNWNLK